MAKQTKKTEHAVAKTESVNANSKQEVSTRGRVFEGFVTKKFPKRIVLEFQRTVYIQKYARFYKKKTKLHARLPDSMEKDINVGDYIQIMECRPLSKIIHFIVVKKIRNALEAKK